MYTHRIWPLLFPQDVPAYLEAMEQRGLRFRKKMLYGLLAEFERVEPTEARYEWDYFKPHSLQVEETILSYLDFYEAAGWEIVWQFEYNKIFRAADGKNPAPINTDEEIKREKQKKGAKKDEIYQGCSFLFVIIALAFIVGRFSVEQFVVSTAYQQFVTIAFPAICLLLAGDSIWNGIRHYRGVEKKEFTTKRCFIATFYGVVQLLVLVAIVLQPALDEGDSAVACGVLIGLPIGIAIRRASMGLGGEACRMGMKGIPNCGWKRTVCSLGLIALAIALLLSPAIRNQGGEPNIQEGSNLYCKTFFREGNLPRAISYYEAKDEAGALKIMSYYLERKMESWEEGKWEAVSISQLPSQLPLTKHYPMPTGQDGEAYHLVEPIYEQEGAGYYLVRKGTEVWFTFRPHQQSSQ